MTRGYFRGGVMIKYSYDRTGRVVPFDISDNPTEEEKHVLKLLKERRGIYDTVGEAMKAAKNKNQSL